MVLKILCHILQLKEKLRQFKAFLVFIFPKPVFLISTESDPCGITQRCMNGGVCAENAGDARGYTCNCDPALGWENGPAKVCEIGEN